MHVYIICYFLSPLDSDISEPIYSDSDASDPLSDDPSDSDISEHVDSDSDARDPAYDCADSDADISDPVDLESDVKDPLSTNEHIA